MNPYALLSRYYSRHWEEYSLDYLPFLDMFFCELIPHRQSVTIADMGCGNGHLSFALAARGYRVYGVEISPDMLREAERALSNRLAGRDPESAGLPRFYGGDMKTFTFPRETHCVLMAYDAVNYLSDEDEVFSCLRHYHRQLPEDGLIVFDSNTPEIYRAWDGVREEYDIPGGCIFQMTSYNNKTRTGHTEFRFDLNGESRSEYHVQRVYEPDEMLEMIYSAGFKRVSAFDDFDLVPMDGMSQKPIFVAQKG